MDLKGLENALNSGDFKEQVYSSLNGIYQISKVLNQLEILDNFLDHDSKIEETIATIKSKLAGYETSEQELKAQIDALVSAIEAKKQELEARLNVELQNATTSEIAKLNEAGSEIKNNFVRELTQAKNNLVRELPQAKNNLVIELTQAKNNLVIELTQAKNNFVRELTQAKNNLALELEKLKTATQSLLNTPRIEGVNLKFVGINIYGHQKFFTNESDEFRELFKFDNIKLKSNKSYIVQFSMPYACELSTSWMGEMVLCLKANDKVYPIINSFYQNKISRNSINKVIDSYVGTYRVNSVLKTPSEEAEYKIAVFARKHKDICVNVNYVGNLQGFETSFLNNAKFANLTTHSIPTEHSNDRVFYKHSQALVYEILE
ncbi:hypothetical protein KVM77_01025 [Helicobacter pylori]|nr:hypothetical protein KVM77_01025 [Helicobacter pylori]